MKSKNYKSYAKAYNNIVKNKIKVTGIKYDTYVEETIEIAEEYRQCYKKGDRVREQLPRYWFISKTGFLISVRNQNEPKWVSPNLNQYRPQFKISKGNKPITTYVLTALVWDGFISEDAKKILNQKGLKSIGRFEREHGLHIAKVQGHHTKGYLQEKTLENYITNNDPAYVQIVTVREHIILDKIQKGIVDEVQIFYQPDFRNVPSNEIQAYDISTPRMLDLNKIKIAKILSVSVLPEEKDSIITDKYIFVSENNRDFLKKNEKALDFMVDKFLQKYANSVVYNCFEFQDTIVFYKKLKEVSAEPIKE